MAFAATDIINKKKFVLIFYRTVLRGEIVSVNTNVKTESFTGLKRFMRY